MDFFTIILFMALYYVRPHDWIFIFKVIPVIKVTVILALLSLFHKHRGLGWRDVIQTPQDWMMFFYLVWMVGTSHQKLTTFTQVYNLFTFYVVTAITLTSVSRIQKFFNWWAIWIVVLAALALLSEFGFDPTESQYLTIVTMKGRLAFNTSIFNNANALGHSIVPVIVMLYFIGFWKRPIPFKIGTIFILLIPLYCVYETVSKGAFLTGFATILVAFTFRRPIFVQALIVVLALTAGVTALKFMPRMEEIENSKSNEAIQGRVHAFRFGLDTMRTKFTGVGWARFEPELYNKLGFQKAPHSSYVRVGGELGRPGLFLFLGIIYCCVRTLLFCKTDTEDEERIRRTLFVIIVSYVVSSWMVGWADRATFFLMAAATSAFHRYLYMKNTPNFISETNQNALAVTISDSPAFQTALPPANGAIPSAPLPPPALSDVATPTSEIHVQTQTSQAQYTNQRGIVWNRIGLIDITIIALLTLATEEFWAEAIRRM